MSSANARPGRFHWRRPVRILLLVAVVAVAVWQTRVHTAAWGDLKEGRAALQRDDPAEARRHLERCLTEWPQSGEANLLAAQAARRCGDLDAAQKYLKRADRFGRAAADIEVEQALVRAQSGYLGEVEPAFVKWIVDGHPQANEMIALLVPVYLADFRIVEVGKLTAKWVELRPNSPKAWAYRADILERLRSNRELVIAARRRLAELTPDDRVARLNLVRVLLVTRQPPDEAAGHLEWLLAADPVDPPVLVQLAACREAQGRPDEAVAILDRVIAAAPGNAKALFDRGRLEMNRGRPVEAIRFLRRSAELDPSNDELLYTLFLGVRQTGTAEEARAAEERWRRCANDLQRVSELGRAIGAAPDKPELRCEIGELFLRNGQTVEGLRWLESALRIDPRHAPTHRVLAAHYERTGRPDLARHHNALTTDPSKRDPDQ